MTFKKDKEMMWMNKGCWRKEGSIICTEKIKGGSMLKVNIEN
jgi:hypothetical protein